MHSILNPLCEHYSINNVPFINRTKTPFKNNNFETNLSLVTTTFYTRQIAVVTGCSGSGKSSLLFYAMNNLEPTAFRVCHIELSNPNKRALYKTIAVKLGLVPLFQSDDIKLQIIRYFSEENEQGKFNCILIDEAHTLSIPMIDEIRSFYDEGSNFSMILAGLPSLLSKTLALSINQPMKQRINIAITIDPLSLSQTKEYILHQLDLVNLKTAIFDEKCYSYIYTSTSGVPRRINQLCYSLLLQNYFDKKTIIIEEDIVNLIEKHPHIF